MPPLLLTFEFPSSRVAEFPQVLEQAKQGEYHERLVVQGKREVMVYTTTFPLTQDAEEVKTVLLFAQSLKAERRALVTVNSIPMDRLVVAKVLECYYHSLQCTDPRGYCWIPAPLHGERWALTFSLQDLEPQEPQHKWLFPCRHAARASHRMTLSHPAGLRAQAEAALVEYNCAWCPQLRLDAWEMLFGDWRLDERGQPGRP